MNLRSDGLLVKWYLRPKPVGKVRRRLQEMRLPSAQVSTMDLSHSESARLATDALLDQGMNAYKDMLISEGEVDHLSTQEKMYMLGNVRDPKLADEEDLEEDQKKTPSDSASSQTYFPVATESDPPLLDHGWPVAKWSYHLQGIPSVELVFQANGSTNMKDLLRGVIRKATTVLAIVMDIFSDVEIFCDLLEATGKRNVSVYLLLERNNLPVFTDMCENLQISSSLLNKMSVRSVHGETYCAKSGRKFTGEIKEKFVIADCTQVLVSSQSFTWLSWQADKGFAILIKGCGVKPFDTEFRALYAMSKAIPGLPALTRTDNIHRPLQRPPPDRSPRKHTSLPITQWTYGPLLLPCTENPQTGPPWSQWLSHRYTVHRPVVGQRTLSRDHTSRILAKRPPFGAACLPSNMFSNNK